MVTSGIRRDNSKVCFHHNVDVTFIYLFLHLFEHKYYQDYAFSLIMYWREQSFLFAIFIPCIPFLSSEQVLGLGCCELLFPFASSDPAVANGEQHTWWTSCTVPCNIKVIPWLLCSKRHCNAYFLN